MKVLKGDSKILVRNLKLIIKKFNIFKEGLR